MATAAPERREGKLYRSIEELDRRFFPEPVEGFGGASADPKRTGARLARNAARRVMGDVKTSGSTPAKSR
jgi:hypothetical protein